MLIDCSSGDWKAETYRLIVCTVCTSGYLHGYPARRALEPSQLVPTNLHPGWFYRAATGARDGNGHSRQHLNDHVALHQPLGHDEHP